MKIVFFSNFIDHHTAPLCSELYRLTNGDFVYVELTEMPDTFKKSGYPDFSTLPFILPVWKNKVYKKRAVELCKSADVALFNGYLTNTYANIRAKEGKISFDLSERLLKQGILNVLSPGALRYLWCYYTCFKKAPFYKLCKGAYGATDQYRLHTYHDKCYNWAYFSAIPMWDGVKPINITRQERTCRIMWCSRFIDWKHPELMIKLGKSLKDKGYSIKIDMYGSGKLLKKTRETCESLGLGDVISFLGNIPNSELMLQMRQHNIFVLTSDKQEGWGVVANEAMSNGCVFVGSDEAGSVPSLVRDKINGCIFKANDFDSLERTVLWIINHPEEFPVIAKKAYETMSEVWSPRVGACRLLKLIDSLQKGEDTPFVSGPCSKQYPIVAQ